MSRVKLVAVGSFSMAASAVTAIEQFVDRFHASPAGQHTARLVEHVPATALYLPLTDDMFPAAPPEVRSPSLLSVFLRSSLSILLRSLRMLTEQ
jgi:hypothetical protein